MGTLFSQIPRTESLENYVFIIRKIAHNMGYDLEQMTTEQWKAVAIVTQTALAIQSADVFDEQLAGFGEILRDYTEKGE